jgi:hypothetical protein
VASGRACNTMQVWVRSDARVHACMPEHHARSGRAGRPDGITLAWVGGGAQSRSSVAGPGNWSVGSRWCWQRGDGLGGGRCGSAHVGCPRWPWRRPGAAWGDRAAPLCRGARLGFLQGWRTTIGGRWRRWWSKNRGRGRGSGRGLGLPSSLSIQPDSTRADLWQDFVLG